MEHLHEGRQGIAAHDGQAHIPVPPRQVVQGRCSRILPIRLGLLHHLYQGRNSPRLNNGSLQASKRLKCWTNMSCCWLLEVLYASLALLCYSCSFPSASLSHKRLKQP